jgi:hypothetical protein
MDSELLKGRADLSCGGVGTNDYREKTKRIGGDGAMDRRRDPRAFFFKEKSARVKLLTVFIYKHKKCDDDELELLSTKDNPVRKQTLRFTQTHRGMHLAGGGGGGLKVLIIQHIVQIHAVDFLIFSSSHVLSRSRDHEICNAPPSPLLLILHLLFIINYCSLPFTV